MEAQRSSNFRNDYWTVTSGIGYIIDDKTDFYADYYFYCANDYLKTQLSLCHTDWARPKTPSQRLSRAN